LAQRLGYILNPWVIFSVTGVVVVFAIVYLFKNLVRELKAQRDGLSLEAEASRTRFEEALTRSRMESQQTMKLVIDDLQTRLGGLQSVTESKLDGIRGEVDKKLSETVSKNLESFSLVSKRLEELQVVAGQVVTLGQGVSDLSRILESPKLRGAMGEFQLGEMLRQVLPLDVFEEQYALDPKAKEQVDAVIKLKEGFLCIDSKFPLSNAKILLEANVPDEDRKKARKAFSQDVKSMADSIADKYILPEVTLDFALMFIPAESVFYELLQDMDLHQYCLKKRVIPVSPNSFYAYLQAIAVGFRGLKIQAEAKKIESVLARLKVDFEKFGVDFSKVGKHLRDAQTQFSNVETRIARFGTIIEKLGLETPEVLAAAMPSQSTSESHQDQFILK
jgi:DNA recombination protein RmuC